MEVRPRILLVDDDDTIREHLVPVLERGGFDVSWAADGNEALTSIAESRPDMVVLDVMMPNLDGRETLRRIRSDEGWLPVILLTQVGESYERAAALDEGADDYLNKPFDPSELMARIRAVLRRFRSGAVSLTAAGELSAGRLRIDRTARRIWLDANEVTATPKAFALLEFLMARPDEVFSRDRLLQSVWGFDAIVSTRAVDHRVAELRRLLGDDPSAPVFIETLPSVGYRFCAAVSLAQSAR